MKAKMNLYKILGGTAALLLSASMVSCSEDYLDVPPVTSFDTNTITSSIEGATAGYYGLCSAMYCQYGDYQNYYSMNGEPWVAMYYGDIVGSDYFSWIWAGRTNTWALNWTSMTNDQSWIPLMGWFYGYTLVSASNNILVGIDNLQENTNQRDFIKAGCLTMRAHAYVRLLQLFAPRWEDSNEGQTKCIVMRTTPTTGDSPLVSMNDVLKQIYNDLDNAIGLYERCKVSRTYNWEPNLQVAKGIYARAAMLKNDYKTAQTMAHDARQGFTIMSAEQYCGGFAEPNQEWMWNNDPSPVGIYYYAWGSWYTCNGPYPTIWGFGPGAINYDLYREMDEKDIRRKLFFTPDKLLYQGLKPADFWNIDAVDPDNMDMNGKSAKMSQSIMYMNEHSVPGGDVAKWGLPNRPRTEEADQADHIVVPFGAQYKFWSLDTFGSSAFPYMRGAEMLLTEAEAAYHNEDTGTAQSCLNELNSKRVEGYTCATTGQALLDEIKVSRRLELWGEGHSWFDLKRWGDKMERRAWVENDMSSGNIPLKYAVTMEPDVNHGWRYALPLTETQYNGAIRPSELGY